MAKSMSVRLPEEMNSQLEEVADEIERSKSYLVKKAIEKYLNEYIDYRIALDRLNDKDDEIISAKDMRKSLGA